jgi:tryptophan-rich hypothetical protein
MKHFMILRRQICGTMAKRDSVTVPRLSFFLPMAKKQRFPHLLGSKWTARQETWGWRHFRVINRKNQGDWVFAEMVAACDPSIRFWINAKALKDPEQWNAGWQPLAEIQAES